MELLLFYFSIAICVSFLCSILEAVILSATPLHIESLVAGKRAGAKLLYKRKEDIDTSVSAILTINTFAHTLGASGVGIEAAKIWGEEYMFVISFILTIGILLFSEIIPKTIGATYWRNLAISSSYIIHAMVFITYPIVIVTNYLTRVFKHQKVKMSRDEIRAATEIGERDGAINQREGDLIENSLQLKERNIHSIMTPRSVLFAFDENTTIQEFLQTKDYDNFSRIPIYKDSHDNITGIALLRTILMNCIDQNTTKKLKDIALPVFTLRETISVSKTLELFIKRNEHIFIVENEYGMVVGIVTLEDAIETLLGVEITDEFDDVEDMQLKAKMLLRQKNRR